MLNVWVLKLGVNELSYAAAPGQFFDSIQKERTFSQCRVLEFFIYFLDLQKVKGAQTTLCHALIPRPSVGTIR